jgi:TolA-binding protein
VYLYNGNVGIANSEPGHTLSIGSNVYFDDTGSNTMVTAANISAPYITSNGKFLSDTTDAAEGVYGGVIDDHSANIAIVTVGSDGRIGSVSNATFTVVETSVLDDVVNRGNATSNTVLFQNASTALVTTSNVGIANSEPVHTLSIGSNIYFDDTGSNTLVTTANISAPYITSNGKFLSDTTDAVEGVYGGVIDDHSANIAIVTVGSDGRIESVSNATFTVVETSVLEDVVNRGNATSNTVLFQNATTALVTTSNVGIANSAPGHTLSIGSNIYFDDTGSNTMVTAANISAPYITSNGKFLSDTTDAAEGVYGGVIDDHSANIAIVTVGSDGRIESVSNATFTVVETSVLEDVVNRGNATSNTVLFQNATTALVTTSNVGIANSAPGHTLSIGSNVYFDDTGSNTVVTTANISAPYITSNGKFLSDTTDAVEGVYGGVIDDHSANIAIVTVGSDGRIESVSNATFTVVETSVLEDVVNRGNATSNTVLFQNATTALVTTSNVGIANSAPGHTLSIGSNVYFDDTGSNTVVTTANISAPYITSNGKFLSDTTDAVEGVYGGVIDDHSANIAIVTVDSDGRIESVSNATFTVVETSVLEDVVNRGNATSNTVLFQNATTALVTTSNVGIANSAPGHTLSIGSNVYFDDAGSNTMVTAANISAPYITSNGKFLSDTTDAAEGVYGGVIDDHSANIAIVTVGSDGRIGSVSNATFTVVETSVLEDVVNRGNATSNTVRFTNVGTSLITSGRVGVANSAPGHTLSIGSNVYFDDTGSNTMVTAANISAPYITSNGKFLSDTTDAAEGVYGGVIDDHSANIAIVTVGSDGRIGSVSNATFTVVETSVLEDVVNRGNATSNTVRFTNVGTSLITSGRVGVANSAPGHALSVGTRFHVDEGAASTNVAVVNGNVAATYYYGDAGFLSNISDLASTTRGSASLVPQITFDAKGRISSVAETAVQSNVDSATVNQLAFYTSATQVAGFSALTKDGDNMTLAGDLQVEDITINGNLHVAGNTIVHDSVTINDPVLQVGNVNVTGTDAPVGMVFARADANVAVAYKKSNDGQAASTLVFGYTSNNGAQSDVIINAGSTLPSKFYGTIDSTGAITTAAQFNGSGAGLSDIQLSNISDNLEANFTSNVSRIGTLETDLSSNATRIGTLETDLSSNATRIGTLETDLSSNASRIGTLETDLSSNASRIGTLETDLSSNATRIGTLETDLSSNASRIGTLETDLSSNATRIGTLETDLSSNASRIGTLETDLSSNASRIGTLETDLSSNASRIGTLETDLGIPRD